MLAQIDGRPAALLTLFAADRPGVQPPVELVARLLGSLQRVVWLLAAAARADRQEPRAGERRRLELTCQPQEGGYLLALGGVQLALALDWGAAPQVLMAGLLGVWEAISAQDLDGVEAVAPDRDLRERLLADLRRALPKPSEPWRVALDGVIIGPAAVKHLERHLAAARVTAPAVLTLTGELLGVDFNHGTFSLRYPVTRKTLTGRYAKDAEVWLLKHRRKPIQVDGEFTLDAQQRPQACVKAVRFRAVDLAPLVVSGVPLSQGELVLDPPLSLVPTLDEATQQRYEAREDGLGLYAEGTTREELEAEVLGQIAAIWARLDGMAETDPVLARLWRRRARVVVGAYQEA